jgi:hypothetical protein
MASGMCWLNKSASYMSKTLTEAKTKVKTTHARFNCCMGVFVGDTADEWLKCNVMKSQIRALSTMMVLV